MTTDEYLQKAIDKFRVYFNERGIYLSNKVQAHMGWPSYGVGSAENMVSAECWPKGVSKDRANHIFISPKVSNTTEVLTVLSHELIHAAIDCEGMHGKKFQRKAAQIGLVEPWECATASPELLDTLWEMQKELGEYPHAGFWQNSKVYGTKQKSYWKRLNCQNHPDYFVRTTSTQMNKGMPRCGICGERLIESSWSM